MCAGRTTHGSGHSNAVERRQVSCQTPSRKRLTVVSTGGQEVLAFSPRSLKTACGWASGNCPEDYFLATERPDQRAPVAACGFRYWSSQSSTVLHHNRRLRGLSTQCPSSGKYRNFAGTPIRRAAVNA